MSELTRDQQIADSQGTKNAQTLAEIYVKVGHDACLTELNKVVETQGLLRWEVSVLANRVRELLVNNGIIIQRGSKCL